VKHEVNLSPRRDWLSVISYLAAIMILAGGCGTKEIRPVDIFPEDNCTQCRMAISDERFASEIIDQNAEVVKFDDLGCMLKYRARHADLKITAIFLKDYGTKQWTRYERAAIVETSVETPMGSGKVAFSDAEKASAFKKQYPKIVRARGMDTCCE